MLEIISVSPDSIAEELDLKAGDKLVTANGQPVRDLIDARFYLAEEDLSLLIETQEGEHWELEIERDPGVPLGLEFAHPEPELCGNNCQFCYVHQLPRGLRQSLYLKDEDYRFSFLYGAYVTLANLGETELNRILQQRLSPLYISIHATDPDVRSCLLGKEVEPVLPLLRRLVDGGIRLHTQVVLCPGINDDAILEQTISELSLLRPGIESLAVVPVGLTSHRGRLPELRTPTAGEAAAVIDMINHHQQRCQQNGGRFVFAADEFYLKSKVPLPEFVAYEDFPQLENGVGMIADFRYHASGALDVASNLSSVSATTVTGQAFFQELDHFARQLSAVSEARLQVVEVESLLLGPEISVAGLLSGHDILTALQGKRVGDGLLLPEVLLKEGTDMLLDDISLDDLSKELCCPVLSVEASAPGLMNGLSELALKRNKQ